MLVLSAADLRQLITMEEAIQAVAVALRESSAGRAVVPIRTAIPVSQANGTSLFMPALVQATDSLGGKFVSVFPMNKGKGKETIYGVMILSDVDTGEPLALLEASQLTILRTGAAAGLATRHLARTDASVLGVIGTGAQATGVIEAILAVRPLREIRLYNRTPAKAEELAGRLRQQVTGVRLEVVAEADRAVAGADIVVTATNHATPVFSAEVVSAGTHINAIGSFRPEMQELPTEIIAGADKVVVESREAALEETGDLIVPIEQGVFTSQQLHAELGEIVAGTRAGRERDQELTVFKSVGLAAMDVVVARQIYERAREREIGQRVVLW
ncbi:NAD(P)-binding domain-containing protein [Brevibacillus humidisoli]|uniref:NAD(P)-binding domain-containing protein n=1 Tax=Brevibacillus humidisoli TaxID=2895522 RepID=UPI001E4CE81D|nr:NAD(P)-binding domain-containing protein [Brevibacillus humidisoli]UFJ39553.1 NAD(P)-binding domain-containing protein [Brevibacillus humidisoli]